MPELDETSSVKLGSGIGGESDMNRAVMIMDGSLVGHVWFSVFFAGTGA